MRMLRDSPAKIYVSESAAGKVANALLEADEDGWSYAVISDPSGSGRATIRIDDEHGEEVGYWTTDLDRMFKPT